MELFSDDSSINEKKIYAWLILYANDSDDVKKLALQKLHELPQTFTEWNFVSHLSITDFPNSELYIFAVQKMSEVAKTFDEWLIVYFNTRDDLQNPALQVSGDVKKLVVQKMFEVIQTYKELESFLCEAACYHFVSQENLQKLVAQKMAELLLTLYVTDQFFLLERFLKDSEEFYVGTLDYLQKYSPQVYQDYLVMKKEFQSLG